MKNNIRTNVVINLIRTLALTILSFLTFPYVCQVLLDAEMGLYTWANTFVYYFLVLAKIGIPNLAIRECVSVKDDKEKLSNKAQAFFILQSVTTVISFAAMCGFVFAVPQLFEARDIIFLLSINFLSGAFSFEWIYIALEKQFYMSVRSIIILALSAILIIVFVKNPDDLPIYSLITAGVTVITSIVNLIFLSDSISFKKTMPYNYKQYVRPLTTLFVLSMLLALYNQTDTFILGFLNMTKEEVGAYSVGIKGIDIIIGVIAGLSTVFIPRAAYYYGKEDKRFFNNLNKYSMNICMFIVMPAVITMSIMSTQICKLIAGNTGYDTASWVLIALASMMITYSLGDIIYGQILLPMKKEKYYLFAILGGVILNIILSLVLGIYAFKEHPSIGVAIGTMVTDLLVLVYLVSKTWKWVKKPLFNKNTLKLLIGNGLVLLMSLLLIYWTPIRGLWNNNVNITYIGSLALELVSVVIIDAIIYFVSLALMKEDLVYSLIRRKKDVQEASN